MANTIGTAYINIAPNMTGIQGKIAGGLRGSGSQFADQFGGEISGRSAIIVGAIAGVAQAGVTQAIDIIKSSLNSAVSRVDILNSFPRVLEAMGASASDAKASTDKLSKSLIGLPTTLSDGAQGVQQFVAAGLTVPHATDAFLAMNDALLAGGANSQDTQIVMQSLTRALSGGTTAASTIQAALSRMPTALQALEKQSGKSATALYNLYAANPQQLATDLVNLDKNGTGGLASLSEQAKQATLGIGTSFDNMRNAVVRGLANIIQAIGQKNISDAIAKIGKAFEKVLDIVAKDIPIAIGYIKSMVDFVDRHKGAFETLAVVVGAVVTAMLALMIANKVEMAITAVQKAMVGAQVAMATYTALTEGGTGAMVAFDAAFDANPISLIIIAIVALVAGLAFFFTKTALGKKIFGDFLGFLTTVWDGIKTGFGAVANFFTGVWNGITTGLAAVGNFFQGIWNSISNAVSAFLAFFAAHWRIIILIVLGPLGLLIDLVTAYWSTITGAISTALSAIWRVISGVFNAVAGFIGGVFSTIGGYISTAVTFYWNIISTVFGAIAGFMGAVFGPPINAIIGVFQWLGGIISGVVSGIWGGITGAFKKVTDFLGGVGSTIKGLFVGAASWLYDTGKDIIDGLINGAKSLLGKIGEMFLNVIPGWIKEPFKKALGIHSPSTVFGGYADDTVDGYTNTIAGRQRDVTDAINGMATAAIGGMSSPIAAQFGTQVSSTSPVAAAALASQGAGSVSDPNAPAVVQNNNIYNQVDLNSVTRELAWQIRR